MSNFKLQPLLGERIVKWRQVRRVSRRKLAKAIGISHQSLKHIEDGSTASPRVHSLMKIANYFGRSLTELLGEQLSDNILLVKVPPNIYLTEADKRQLRLRIDFEISLMKSTLVSARERVTDHEIK